MSGIEPNESRAVQAVQNVFPDEVIEQIVNRYVPNLYLMLEHSYRAIQKARLRRGMQLAVDDLEKFESARIHAPTEVELMVLDLLSKNSFRPKELIAKTSKNRGTITKCIKSLYADDLVEKKGTGKRVRYSITQKGEAARAIEKK